MTEKIKVNKDEFVEVSDLSGRTYMAKKSSLKPSTWVQGNQVSTRI